MNSPTPVALARELHDLVAAGHVLDAFDRLYADDVVMIEHGKDPFSGKELNRRRERAFLDGVAEWKGYDVLALAGDGDVTFAEIRMAFTTTGGEDVTLHQISRCRWRNGQIVEERFFPA